jgi:hypothetical protein
MTLMHATSNVLTGCIPWSDAAVAEADRPRESSTKHAANYAARGAREVTPYTPSSCTAVRV